MARIRKRGKWLVLSLCGVILSACGKSGSGDSQADAPSGGAAGGGGFSTGAGPSSGAAAMGGGGDGPNSAGGVPSDGGNAEPGGGAGSAGSGSGGGESTPSCDEEFSCPDLGDCHLSYVEDGCERICAVVATLGTNDDVASIAALKCDVLDGSLRVEGSVDSLAGLETIRDITGVLIMESAPLQDLSGLDSLETVGSFLYLLDLPELQSVHLPLLRSVVEGMSVRDCPTVTDIDLPLLETVGQTLNVMRATSLLTLHGLPSLISAPYIIMQGNTKLPQCEVSAIITRVGASCSLQCTGNDEDATCD